MAYTDQEKEIIRFGATSGKSKSEVADALAKYRRVNRIPSDSPKEQTFLKDLSGDVKQTFQGVQRAVETGAQRQAGELGQAVAGDESNASGLLQFLGQGARATSNVVGELVKGGVKSVLPPRQEQQVSSAVQDIGESIGGNKTIQNILTRFEQLKETNPELAGNIDATLGLGELALDVFTGGVAEKGVSKTLKVAREGADIASDVARQSVDKTVDAAKGGLKKVRQSDLVTPIEERVKTELKKTTPQKFDDYLKSARDAVADTSNPTPLEIAGNRAGEALDTIQRKLQGIGSDKSIVIRKAKNATKDMSVSVRKARLNLQRAFKETTLDGTDNRLVNAIRKELQTLSKNPTAIEVDKFIDFAQDQLFKSSKDLTVPVSGKVISKLRLEVSKLNNSLKQTVGGGYRELNRKYSEMIKVRDQLNKALGKRGDKGGSLVKRIFSPTDGGTKKLFERVKKETGIDLFEEGVLARFVMEISGDVRQSNILEKLGVLTQGKGGVIKTITDKFLNKLPDIEGKAKSIIDSAKKPKIINRKPTTEGAFGAVAGIEVDENGNITFNPFKGVVGIAGFAGLAKATGGIKKTLRPDIVARNIDVTDMKLMSAYLKRPTDLNLYLKIQPLFRAIGIDAAEESLKTRFIKDVLEEAAGTVKIS